MAPKVKAKKGAQKPDVNHSDYLFYHKEWEEFGFLSNYSPAKLTAPDPALVSASWLVKPSGDAQTSTATDIEDIPMIEFDTSEQYYMYCKAVCFSDNATAKTILEASKGSDCKDAAHHVTGFDASAWDDRKLRVMADALWHKFGGAHLQQVLDDGGDWLGRDARLSSLPDLGRKLLDTGDRVLVEAAGRDSGALDMASSKGLYTTKIIGVKTTSVRA